MSVINERKIRSDKRKKKRKKGTKDERKAESGRNQRENDKQWLRKEIKT